MFIINAEIFFIIIFIVMMGGWTIVVIQYWIAAYITTMMIIAGMSNTGRQISFLYNIIPLPTHLLIVVKFSVLFRTRCSCNTSLFTIIPYLFTTLERITLIYIIIATIILIESYVG